MKRYITEKDVETKLITEVKRAGGLCLKFVSPGWSGAPDRLVLFPKGRMSFVELKAPGKAARPLQRKRHERLRSLGYPVYLIDCFRQVREFVKEQTAGDTGA